MGSPLVLYANHFQFAAGQRLENPCVGSRMLLWCRQGLGAVEVDGQRRVLEPDAWLLLPWRHRVVYTADRRHPFLVGGIHLCPDHDPGLAELRVPHQPDDPLQRSPLRRDVRWSGLDGLAGGSFAGHPGLRLLGEWIVGRWNADPVDPDQARAMAALLLDELRRSVGRAAATSLPVVLQAAVEVARRDLAKPLDLAAMARAAGCSPATLVRLFRRHLRNSPMAWLRAERIEEARRLLASSALPVAMVGLRVGIDDPHRFAKTFRAATGHSPRTWRQTQRL
jgi:AraC-like DNA-binding protein